MIPVKIRENFAAGLRHNSLNQLHRDIREPELVEKEERRPDVATVQKLIEYGFAVVSFYLDGFDSVRFRYSLISKSYDMAQAGTPFFVLFDKKEANGDVKIMGVAQDQF